MRSSELLPGLTALLHADGSLELRGDEAAPAPFLTARLETPPAAVLRRSSRRGPEAAPHLGRAAEGCPGGHRGFSARADDDGDGLVDEDRLDGLDNDGDGLVDEDFAAISDVMISLTAPPVAGGGRAEYYHWGHARLQGTVFASLGGAEGSRWALATDGAPWVDVGLEAERHSATGKPVRHSVNAFVTQVDPAGDCRSGSRWIGVAVLDEPGSDRTGRALIDGRDLSIGLGEAPLAVAVCAAESWSALAQALTEARRVREGVVDPVTGERAPWIVAPRCPNCRAASPPRYTWHRDRQGDLVLVAEIAGDGVMLPDPDLLQVAGLPLGAPSRISWRPRDGQEQGIAWSCVTAAGLARGGVHQSDPYAPLVGVRTHGAAGSLEFRFVDPAPAVLRALAGALPADLPARELTQAALDGRRLAADLEQGIGAGGPVHAALALARSAGDDELGSAARQSQLLRSGRTQPQLAPELLEGWPNPFRDQISLRIRVPATIGEAFTWDDQDERPSHLDLAAPVPWQHGVPDATLKIYTMSGQELVTLHAGQVGGETTLTWNGTDAHGRKMASGTYFCKLQLDDWSVTRRLVYLR